MDLQTLFNHQQNKFGVVTVMNVLLKNTKTGKPMLKFNSLKISNINFEGQEKEIRGGLAAGVLVTYGYGRTATVEIEDALASMESLQYMFGAGNIDTEGIQYTINEKLVVENDKVNLSKTPVAGTIFALDNTGAEIAITEDGVIGAGAVVNDPVTVLANDTYDLTTDGTGTANAALVAIKDVDGLNAVDGVNYTVAGTVITFLTGGDYTIVYNADTTVDAIVDGTELEVFYETISLTGEDVQQITLKSTDFPDNARLVGHTFLVDEKTGAKILTEIEFPKFKLSPSFSLTLDGEGDASSFSFSGKAMENEEGQMMLFKKLGAYNKKRSI